MAGETEWNGMFDGIGDPKLMWNYTLVFEDSHLDPYSQLLAIRELISLLQTQEDREAADIREAERVIPLAQATGEEYAEDGAIAHYNDLVQLSIYRDAARSMAAAAMLVPFLEGVFRHYFTALGQFMESPSQVSDGRRALARELAWNCELVFDAAGPTKDIVRGVRQLAGEIGLGLPTDFLDRFEALVTYRNRMFHWGFEWPIDKREAFEAWINKMPHTRGSWFAKSGTGKGPWIFYLDNAFVMETLGEFDEAFSAMIQYAHERKPVDAPPLPDWLRKLAPIH